MHGSHAENLGVLEACRFPAELRAMAACSDTILHLSEPLAVLRANLADISAQGTNAVVELALVRKEVGGRRANRGTIEHQADVLRPGVFAAKLEAVRHHHREAGRVALCQRVHARVDLVTEPVGNLCHRK
jgi:hypothetical protein